MRFFPLLFCAPWSNPELEYAQRLSQACHTSKEALLAFQAGSTSFPTAEYEEVVGLYHTSLEQYAKYRYEFLVSGTDPEAGKFLGDDAIFTQQLANAAHLWTLFSPPPSTVALQRYSTAVITTKGEFWHYFRVLKLLYVAPTPFYEMPLASSFSSILRYRDRDDSPVGAILEFERQVVPFKVCAAELWALMHTLRRVQGPHWADLDLDSAISQFVLHELDIKLELLDHMLEPLFQSAAAAQCKLCRTKGMSLIVTEYEYSQGYYKVSDRILWPLIRSAIEGILAELEALEWATEAKLLPARIRLVRLCCKHTNLLGIRDREALRALPQGCIENYGSHCWLIWGNFDTRSLSEQATAKIRDWLASPQPSDSFDLDRYIGALADFKQWHAKNEVDGDAFLRARRINGSMTDTLEPYASYRKELADALADLASLGTPYLSEALRRLQSEGTLDPSQETLLEMRRYLFFLEHHNWLVLGEQKIRWDLSQLEFNLARTQSRQGDGCNVETLNN